VTHDKDLLGDIRLAALRVAGRLVGSSEAEDIAQEVSLRAVARLTEIADYAGPWAVRVATNLSLDLLRRNDRTSLRELPESLAKAVDSDLRLDLRRALEALPERQRQVLALRHLSDLDERTTADLLGISAGSVKRHLHRALTTLRTSPHLIPPRPAPTQETPMTTYHWTDHSTRAVEPEGGWPTRPWDHWQLESRAGRVSRIAVVDGEPVLDAEGDEVMSGPGFDHEVVKILPSKHDDEPLPEHRLYEDLPDLLGELLREARQESDYFGHIWVGDEHLGLALAARHTPGIPMHAELEAGIARFYDGPFAEGRLAMVHERRAGAAFHRDPVPKTFTWPVEQLLASAEPGIDAKEIARRVMDREHSLILFVTGQT